MDQKLLKSYDKEFMKMAMLKHEEIFRQQVYELHRLYGVQKTLMNSIENNNTIPQKEIRWVSSNDQINGSYKSDQRQGEDHIADLNCQGLIEESEIQLTLGPSMYKTNHHQNRSSSGQSLSSSNSTGSSQNPDPGAPTRENSAWEFTRSSQHPPWLFQALSLKLT